jgi:hypothetical protein
MRFSRLIKLQVPYLACCAALMVLYIHQTVSRFSLFAKKQYDFDMTLYVKKLLRKPERGFKKKRLSWSCHNLH